MPLHCPRESWPHFCHLQPFLQMWKSHNHGPRCQPICDICSCLYRMATERYLQPLFGRILQNCFASFREGPSSDNCLRTSNRVTGQSEHILSELGQRSWYCRSAVWERTVRGCCMEIVRSGTRCLLIRRGVFYTQSHDLNQNSRCCQVLS